VITYSRGGFLALAVVVVLYFVFFPPNRKNVPVIVIAAIVIALFIPLNYYERMLSLGQLFQPRGSSLQTEDSALSSRAVEMLVAWDMFKDRPFFGVGLSNYSLGYLEYSKSVGVSDTIHGHAAHDLYLEVLSELGLIGLTAFITMVLAALRTVWDARKRFLQLKLPQYASIATALGIGFVGYLTAALFIHGPYPRYFYLLLGICYSLKLASSNTIEAELAAKSGGK
jgi:O-antigen ligase